MKDAEHICLDVDNAELLERTRERLETGLDPSLPACCALHPIAEAAYIPDLERRLDRLDEESEALRKRLCELGDHRWHEDLPSGTDDLRAFLLSGAKVPHRCRWCGAEKP